MKGLAVTLLNCLAVCSVAMAAESDEPKFEASKQAVSYLMKDPSSTQFRNIHFGGNNQVFVCGEVNAKNSFGAYSGFTPFFYDSTDGDVTIYDPQSKRADFEADAIKMICK